MSNFTRLWSYQLNLSPLYRRAIRDIYYLAHFSGTTSRDDKWQLKVKEYFVLGDNSPNSRDSRLWENGHSVPEENLIGQAFMVFWPPKRLRIIR